MRPQSAPPDTTDNIKQPKARMPFFKDFRRKKTSKDGTRTPDGTNGSDGSNGSMPTTKSSSTLNSVYAGSSTPASSIQPAQQSTPSLPLCKSTSTMTPSSAPPAIPQRPMPLSSVSNRSSYMGLNTPSINGTSMPKVPTSVFAPRVLSVSDNSWVHQKVLLVYGVIGEPAEKAIDGSVIVSHHQDNFPQQAWPVSDSHFKALVHLTPGPNRLRFDFTSPKVVSNQSSLPTHSSWINVNFLPLINSPPLQLVILLGKDSSGTYDAVPERQTREGNNLELAIKKYRMSAYLWQAFTGEQMFRNGFGRRCFRFEEEWQTGSLTYRDKDLGVMRNEAKVHVIRSEKTVKELRDLDIAQQAQNARRKDDLYTIAIDAVKQHFRPAPGQKQYISLLLLDSHWDTKAQTVTAHAALGGGAGEIQLGIFGSHALQSYPSSIEEIVPAFTDCTRTNTNFVANDAGESGSNWEAANIGIGAHLHEVGHALGLPHRESGVMLRDYTRFSRTFLCREPYSTRTKSPGLRLCLPKDECAWHRLDTLSFKYHPCFRLPTDPLLNPDDSIQVWPAKSGDLIVTSPTGIAVVEIITDEDDMCHAWLEYGNGDVQSGGPPRQIQLTEDELKGKLKSDKKGKKMKLKIHSAGLREQVIEDVAQFCKSKSHIVKLPNGQLGFKGVKLGESRQQGTQPQEVIFESAHIRTKLLSSIKVWHGFALDGLEFCYEDSTSQLFGKRGGSSRDFMFDTRRGEVLLGFYLRAGLWIDGLEILTSLGRRSGVFGNPTGGSGHRLVPPRGYTIAGVSGSCGQWVDGFSLIIKQG